MTRSSRFMTLRYRFAATATMGPSPTQNSRERGLSFPKARSLRSPVGQDPTALVAIPRPDSSHPERPIGGAAHHRVRSCYSNQE
jgi:hypothetical protein